ncbi:hypothetical protein LBBP_04516 (plasmid) [Leptospira borgpetersenii serovar Ballum]|uniref:Uncharacterized protein n=1 Tax=Leptospira borgpetersenii serovar Ballum TaxID=280505 RepID=A0A0S2IM25_LEPBO|nr:hypothetical protein LBBP_00356 [Leptospira borgpetersenii serovar Ballum]ALO28613.1 hypothetical protein LBBP_04516 [Leptospira borgpetersenii serovar Ballum]
MFFIRLTSHLPKSETQSSDHTPISTTGKSEYSKNNMSSV